MLAEVRLGIALGLFETIDDEGFDEFYNDMHPATFKISNNLERVSEKKCNEVRAETACKVLPQLVRLKQKEGKKTAKSGGEDKK